MFCIHCGKELPETSNFCPSCGNAVGETGNASAGEEAKLKEPFPQESLDLAAPPEVEDNAETPEGETVEDFVAVEDLSPEDVRKNMIFAWAIAIVPLTLDIIIGLGGGCLILNIVLCYIDESNLGKQKLNMSDFGWATAIIPVYLYKRAKLLQDGPAYTIVWCVLFALSILCAV